MVNVSPRRRSLRDGRTSRRAASPGVLQSLVRETVSRGATTVAVEVARGGGEVGVGSAVAIAAIVREKDPALLTSAMQCEPLMVSSYRPVSASESVLSSDPRK